MGDEDWRNDARVYVGCCPAVLFEVFGLQGESRVRDAVDVRHQSKFLSELHENEDDSTQSQRVNDRCQVVALLVGY